MEPVYNCCRGLTRLRKVVLGTASCRGQGLGHSFQFSTCKSRLSTGVSTLIMTESCREANSTHQLFQLLCWMQPEKNCQAVSLPRGRCCGAQATLFWSCTIAFRDACHHRSWPVWPDILLQRGALVHNVRRKRWSFGAHCGKGFRCFCRFCILAGSRDAKEPHCVGVYCSGPSFLNLFTCGPGVGSAKPGSPCIIEIRRLERQFDTSTDKQEPR